MSEEYPIVSISEVGKYTDQTVTLQGWVYNKRSSKKLFFILLRDGSGLIQCVTFKGDVSEEVFAIADSLTQESSIRITGSVRADERSPGGYELGVKDIEVVAIAQEYPISKKSHGDAFLMDNRHLWLRSKRQNTILRIRHTAVKAIRDYFDDNGFTLMDSPIFTPNACEGTSTLFGTEYFGQNAYLTQSGQLYQEAGAAAFGKSYCFGPTFRAEKSKTRRHLTEFWMVEPEVAFMELEADMDLAEDFLCTIISKVLDKHGNEMEEVLERDISALKRVQKPFYRLSYDQAFKEIQDIANASDDNELKALLALEWGSDFGSPHETELTKRYDRPVIIHRFPAICKAFYMRQDPNDERLSLSMDVLAPEGYGEIIGGGEREGDLQILLDKIAEHELPQEAFEWYLDLRRYGSVPHAGFGLGLERFVAWVCGLHHLRETIPFARTMDRLYP